MKYDRRAEEPTKKDSNNRFYFFHFSFQRVQCTQQYFESTMVARGCEDDLSMTESRIKASASFFGPSCKPGSWVADPLQDAILSETLNKNASGLLPNGD